MIRAPRSRGDGGVATVELVFYLPVLLLVVFLVVQFSIVGLANQAASGAAREAARAARASGGDPAGFGAAESRGLTFAATVGAGLLDGVEVRVDATGPLQVSAQVIGTARTIVPGFGGRVDVTVTGPVEVFRPDD